MPIATQGLKIAWTRAGSWLNVTSPTSFIPRERQTSPMAAKNDTPARVMSLRDDIQFSLAVECVERMSVGGQGDASAAGVVRLGHSPSLTMTDTACSQWRRRTTHLRG